MIKQIISNNKKLLSNFTYLSILKLVNMLIPLITYPYLIRILGKDMYGLVVFANSTIAYVIIIINFGFNIYATKLVAENQGDKKELSRIVSSILTIKFMLFLLCFVLYIPMIFLIPKFAAFKILFFFSLLTSFSEVIFPIWFFQGIEKMKNITLISFVASFIYTVLLFIMIKNGDDYYLIPLLKFIGTFISGIIGLYILFYKLDIIAVFPKKADIKKHFTESVPFFFSRISSVINSETNTLLIGIFLSMGDVAIYDLAKKLVNLMLIPFNLINQTIYPQVARTKDMAFVKKIMKLSLLFALVGYLFVVVFGKYIIVLFAGEALLPSYSILIIMALIVPINSLSYLLGNTVLVVMNKAASFNKSMFYAMLVYLVIAGVLVLLDMVSANSLVWTLVVVSFFNFAYRFYYTKKFNLL